MIKKRKFRNDKSTDLRTYTGEDRIISSLQMARSMEKQGSNIINVKSSIPSLDAAIGDFRDGEVITISGPTKHGKTLLAQTLTANFAAQHHYPLYFSFEVPEYQFLAQFLDLPKFYMPRRLKSGDLKWLIRRINECLAKHKTRIVFIDHLHYVVDMAGMKNASIDIGAVVRRLKRLAVEKKLIIFILVHTVKNIKDEPSAQDIRDSSFIPQESDCTLMIYRPPKKKEVAENESKLTVEFHRRTGVLKRSIKLVKYKGLLIEKRQLSSATQSAEHSKDRKGAQKSDRIQRRDSKKEETDSKEDQ
jgi:replicative DNA helicase